MVPARLRVHYPRNLNTGPLLSLSVAVISPLAMSDDDPPKSESLTQPNTSKPERW